MKVYIDENYLCHASPAEGLREVELEMMDGKCPTYIEGFRHIPDGESFTDEDGSTYEGCVTYAVRDMELLEEFQTALEDAEVELDDALNALDIILGKGGTS